jgi:hypothetical protein
MDELWQEFCNGVAGVVGELFARALFTKTGLKVALYVMGVGIPLVCYYYDLSPAESQARSIVKAQCHNGWYFYYKNGRMPYTGTALGTILTISGLYLQSTVIYQ